MNILKNRYINRGHFYQSGDFKCYSFYAESPSGICGVDFYIEVTFSPAKGVSVLESHCGRSSGASWSEPEEEISSKGFWKTVLSEVRRFGGLQEIWHTRIGSREW